MTNLISLAERVERLSGPCREVDEAIQAALVGAEIEWSNVRQCNVYYRGNSWVSIGSIPLFTGSFEAVLAIVPEGMSYSLYDIVGKRESARMWNGFGVDALTQGQTPALALLSACLRSLARMKEEEL